MTDHPAIMKFTMGEINDDEDSVKEKPGPQMDNKQRGSLNSPTI